MRLKLVSFHSEVHLKRPDWDRQEFSRGKKLIELKKSQKIVRKKYR